MNTPSGFTVRIPVVDRDGMTIETAARFCAELVRQGVLFEAEMVTDAYGTPVVHVQPTGGF